jgi:hemolysin-activating ACP:hemolysin acyltransferase
MLRHEIFTLSEMCSLLPATDSCAFDADAMLGILMPLLDTRLDTGTQDFAWHYDRIRAAAALGQAEVFFDGYGRLCGFALWTHARPADQRALLTHGPRAVGAGSLASTGNLWMLEMQAFYGCLAGLMQILRDRHMVDAPAVTYFRHARGRRMVKQLTRQDRTRFAQGSAPFRPEVRGGFLRTSEGQAMLKLTAKAIQEGLERGRCLTLLRTSPWFAALPLQAALQRLETPLALGQYRLHLSKLGEPLALLSWAWLDRELSAQWPLRSPESLARHDWNDGDWLCLCDAVANAAGVPLLLADLAGDWLASETWHLLPGWHSAFAPERMQAQAWCGQRRQALRQRPNHIPFQLRELLEKETACA